MSDSTKHFLYLAKCINKVNYQALCKNGRNVVLWKQNLEEIKQWDLKDYLKKKMSDYFCTVVIISVSTHLPTNCLPQGPSRKHMACQCWTKTLFTEQRTELRGLQRIKSWYELQRDVLPIQGPGDSAGWPDPGESCNHARRSQNRTCSHSHEMSRKE